MNSPVLVAMFVAWMVLIVVALAVLVWVEIRWDRREKAAHSLDVDARLKSSAEELRQARDRLSGIDERYRR